MKRRERTAEQRAEFWRECALLVYLPLCAASVAGVLVFVGPELGWLVAAIILPGVYVQAMMSRRHQQ